MIPENTIYNRMFYCQKYASPIWSAGDRVHVCNALNAQKAEARKRTFLRPPLLIQRVYRMHIDANNSHIVFARRA